MKGLVVCVYSFRPNIPIPLLSKCNALCNILALQEPSEHIYAIMDKWIKDWHRRSTSFVALFLLFGVCVVTGPNWTQWACLHIGKLHAARTAQLLIACPGPLLEAIVTCSLIEKSRGERAMIARPTRLSTVIQILHSYQPNSVLLWCAQGLILIA